MDILPVMASALALIVYNELKPPTPKTAEAVAMEKAAVAEDIFFGHYEMYKEKGNPLGAEIGFGWFKITKVDDNNFYLSKSTEMSNASKPKEQMNHTDFETENLPVVQLSEIIGYNIRFKSADGLTEIYITDKK